MHAWAAWVLQKCVYKLLLEEGGNAQLGQCDLHRIGPKTPAVSNCSVYIKMRTTINTKYLFNLSLSIYSIYLKM